jgi:hypothetical protein
MAVTRCHAFLLDSKGFTSPCFASVTLRCTAYGNGSNASMFEKRSYYSTLVLQETPGKRTPDVCTAIGIWRRVRTRFCVLALTNTNIMHCAGPLRLPAIPSRRYPRRLPARRDPDDRFIAGRHLDKKGVLIKNDGVCTIFRGVLFARL